MTQQRVYKLMKRENRWMTKKEIAKLLNMTIPSVNSNVNKLYLMGVLFKKERRITEGGNLWIPK